MTGYCVTKQACQGWQVLLVAARRKLANLNVICTKYSHHLTLILATTFGPPVNLTNAWHDTEVVIGDDFCAQPGVT